MSTFFQSTLPSDLRPREMVRDCAGVPMPVVYASLASTNSTAKELALSGMPHGTLVVADKQTAGRGRLDRRFESPKGCGIYMSLILKKAISKERLLHLTPYTAVSVARAIESLYPLSCGIKWVNDIYIAGKKVVGILTECGMEVDGAPAYAVVGIGINVKQTPLSEEVAAVATSLEATSGICLPRDTLIGAFMREFFQHIHEADGAYLTEYRKRDILLGQSVQVRRVYRGDVGDSDEIRVTPLIEGIASGIGDNGELIVQANGERHLIASGEAVTLHKV